MWDILSTSFAKMFSSVKVPSQFKVELILPLFKRKGLEVHNEDNYRSIAMFSVFCKVLENLNKSLRKKGTSHTCNLVSVKE